MRADSAWRVIDSYKAGGYIPLDFPLRAVCAGLFGYSGTWVGGQRMQSRVRVEHAARRGMKCAGWDSGKRLAVKPEAGGSR